MCVRAVVNYRLQCIQVTMMYICSIGISSDRWGLYTPCTATRSPVSLSAPATPHA